ncbi:NACHT domain-containing protein [Nocardia sp. NPDC049149]|uniref:NACHT domain-containing protein n=1 Tax=Nocardia sp. NPDC049149 TaxID=3364315 RepID=UPI003723E239
MADSSFMTGGPEVVAIRAGAGVAKPIGSWVLRKIRPDVSRAALITHADNLADAVLRRETILRDQLRVGPDRVLDLEFHSSTSTVLAPAGEVGKLSELGAYFRKTAAQRLIVLGKPGAGKTVTAIHLLLDQLADRTTLVDAVRADTPVAVRVNAAGWDGSQRFSRWLANQLTIHYGVHGRVAQALVDTGRILPILDGLDEMDPPDDTAPRAATTLDRLNEVPWRNRPVVVMCRSAVFAAVREARGDNGLHGAVSITLQPLTATDIYCYLEDYFHQLGIPREQWASVTDHLAEAPNGPLAEALRSPWLLGLAADALQRGTKNPPAGIMSVDQPDEIRNVLLDSMVPAALAGTEHTGQVGTYTETEVRIWLGNLADHLYQERGSGRDGADIALDQIWQLAGKWRVASAHITLAALTFGLAAGLVTTFLPKIEPKVVFLLAASMVGLIASLYASESADGIVPGFGLRSERLAWRVTGHSRWRRGMRSGLTIALLLTIVIGVVPVCSWLLGTMSAASAAGGLLALFGYASQFALATGLVVGLSTSTSERLALGQDERRLVRDGFVFALTAGLIFVVVLGLGGVVIDVLTAGDSGYFHGAPGDGMIGGLVAGCFILWLFGLAAQRYLVASLIFRWTGTFPARPAVFLDWARNTGLLRVTGVAYQFRHDMLQQRLA